MKFANKMVLARFDKTLRLLHEDIFVKETIEDGSMHVKLVYMLIQMYIICN